MSQEKIPVVSAILSQQGKFLCQLRDDIPHIRYPGCWGLFGGFVEPDETPEEAITRELQEEISYRATDVSFFGYYPETFVMGNIFHIPLTVDLKDLTLQEGWDMGFLTTDDVIAGKCYSQKAKETRSLAPIYQQILLDFLQLQNL
jgi:8-oxo-dGTP pyrophosphatase MutT (NUDIX family)